MLSQMNLGEAPSKVSRRIHRHDNERRSRKSRMAKNEANILHLIDEVSRVKKIGIPKEDATSNPSSRHSLGYQRKGSSKENARNIDRAAKKRTEKNKRAPAEIPRKICAETPVLPSLECPSHTILSLSALKFQLDSLAYESTSSRSFSGKKQKPEAHNRTRSSSFSHDNSNMNVKGTSYRRSSSNAFPPSPPSCRSHSATMPPPPPPPPRRSVAKSFRPRSASFHGIVKPERKLASGFVPPPPPPRHQPTTTYGLEDID
ncbi:hypothetical protein ACHAXS_006904 [Conticribra weissflogii]